MSIDVLQAKIRAFKNPSAVGLDPQLAYIPQFLQEQAFETYGKTLQGAAAAYEMFCNGILDALKDIVPAVKLQSAYFEALGHHGVAAMQAVDQHAKQLGYYVIMDHMRGDVGMVAESCAQTYLGSIQVAGEEFRPYDCDGITVNGYLGSDGISPFLPYCKEGKNVFLLVKTSNKSSREVQDLISGDRVIHTVMADLAMRWSADVFGKSGYSEIAIVVGATNPSILKNLRQKYDRLFFLVPGYGTQGGSAKDVQYAFDRFGHGALVSASRSILCAWQKAQSDGSDYLEYAKQAAEKMRTDILKFVTIL